jgi:hypothetical protein
MLREILPNLIAMCCSLIAMIELIIVAMKIGGVMGKILKLVTVGIFFSIFDHAAFELASVLNLISEHQLMHTMGIFITLGSLFFIAAGTIGIKNFKK